MKKDKTMVSNLEKVKRYLDRMFFDKSMSFANNEKFNTTSPIQSILLGEMLNISEIKRFIGYIESDKE